MNHSLAFSDVMKASWAHMKERWQTILGISLVSLLATLLALGPIGVRLVGTLGKSMGAADMNEAMLGALVGVAGLAIFAVIVLLIVMPMTNGALLHALTHRAEKAGVGDSLRVGFAKYWSYWWVSLLVAVPSMVIASVFGAFNQDALYLVGQILSMAWSVLAAFSMLVLFGEGIKGIAAIKRSIALVTANVWGLLANGVLFILCTIVFVLLLALLMVVLGFLKTPGVILGALISVVLAVGFGIFSQFFGAELFLACKAKTPKV